MLLLKNKKAFSEYAIEFELIAGVVLSGSEVKSLRLKSGSLSGSFVKIISKEAFLLNAQITPYKFADNREYDPKKTRKLLLKQKEIAQLESIVQSKNRTIVPLSFELLGRQIKLRIGVGRGLKKFEKREKIKKRDQEREISRTIKNYNH